MKLKLIVIMHVCVVLVLTSCAMEKSASGISSSKAMFPTATKRRRVLVSGEDDAPCKGDSESTQKNSEHISRLKPIASKAQSAIDLLESTQDQSEQKKAQIDRLGIDQLAAYEDFCHCMAFNISKLQSEAARLQYEAAYERRIMGDKEDEASAKLRMDSAKNLNSAMLATTTSLFLLADVVKKELIDIMDKRKKQIK